MLSLYEAAYLRTRDESILCEAVEFTKANLSAKLSAMEPHVAERVARALQRPLRKVLDKVEHLFFANTAYQHIEGHDQALLKLAKLNFNVLQHLYQTELRPITEWWIELDTPKKLPYARDKLVETYFWALGCYWEPKHSLVRHFATKITLIGTLLDDTYDIHGTIEELDLFTAAIERWDTSTKGRKDYMIVLFDAIVGIYAEVEANTSTERWPWCLDYLKRGVSNVARLYLEEERRSEANKDDYVPTLDEYRQLSSLTTCFEWIAYAALCGMGDSVSKSSFDWLSSSPTMLIASTDICRLQDDLADNMEEQEVEHFASSVECYMNQYGASRQEAVDGLNKVIEEDWMIMNEELLMNIPGHVSNELPPVLHRLVRFMDTIYKDFDGYTHSATTTKDILMALLVTPLVVT